MVRTSGSSSSRAWMTPRLPWVRVTHFALAHGRMLSRAIGSVLPARPSPLTRMRLTAMFDGKEVAGSVVTVALEAGAPARSPTASANKVFVNNLAYSVTSEDLEDHFASAGEVVSASVFMYGGRSKVRVRGGRVT